MTDPGAPLASRTHRPAPSGEVALLKGLLLTLHRWVTLLPAAAAPPWALEPPSEQGSGWTVSGAQRESDSVRIRSGDSCHGPFTLPPVLFRERLHISGKNVLFQRKTMSTSWNITRGTLQSG